MRVHASNNRKIELYVHKYLRDSTNTTQAVMKAERAMARGSARLSQVETKAIKSKTRIAKIIISNQNSHSRSPMVNWQIVCSCNTMAVV